TRGSLSPRAQAAKDPRGEPEGTTWLWLRQWLPSTIYPRSNCLPHTVPTPARTRGADEAPGGGNGSRGRPAPVWMLTTGRADGGETSSRPERANLSGGEI